MIFPRTIKLRTLMPPRISVGSWPPLILQPPPPTSVQTSLPKHHQPSTLSPCTRVLSDGCRILDPHTPSLGLAFNWLMVGTTRPHSQPSLRSTTGRSHSSTLQPLVPTSDSSTFSASDLTAGLSPRTPPRCCNRWRENEWGGGARRQPPARPEPQLPGLYTRC